MLGDFADDRSKLDVELCFLVIPVLAVLSLATNHLHVLRHIVDCHYKVAAPRRPERVKIAKNLIPLCLSNCPTVMQKVAPAIYLKSIHFFH